MKRGSAPKEKCPKRLSPWGPLGDTHPLRNKIFLRPCKARKGTNKKSTSAKGHSCAYPSMVRCITVRCSTMWCSAVRRGAVRYGGVSRCGMMWCGAWRSVVWCGMWCGVEWFGAVRCGVEHAPRPKSTANIMQNAK